MKNILYEIKDLLIQINGKTILDISNLTFESKKLHFICGPNGSGKTTLMKIMNRLIKIPADTAFYKGNDINKVHSQIRNETVYLHQTPIALDMSVYNNIAFPLKIRNIPDPRIQSRVYEVAKMLEITDLLDKSAVRLSVGELQKCALGRILVYDYSVFFLDEAIASVDKMSASLISEIIMHYVNNEKKTVIYTSHQPFDKKMSPDNTIYIENGKIP